MMLPKLRGERAELIFMLAASGRGLRISKPLGESYPYDVIVDNGHTCWRVQVKSNNQIADNGRYQVHATRAGQEKSYRKRDVDFLAFYLFRPKTWYIIPQSKIGRRFWVTLYAPGRRECGMFSQYFEAWHLLKQPKPCSLCLQPCADPDGMDQNRTHRKSQHRAPFRLEKAKENTYPLR